MNFRRLHPDSREARHPGVHDVRSEVRQFAQTHLRDPETGLPGERRFASDLGFEMRKAPTMTSVVLVRVESMNELPDDAAVSAALLTVVSLIDATRRTGDRCYRVSGNQFALVCPSTLPKEAEELVARIERTMLHATLPGHRLKTLVSWVVADGTHGPNEILGNTSEAVPLAAEA